MTPNRDETLAILKENVVLYARPFALGTATGEQLVEQVEELNTYLRERLAERYRLRAECNVASGGR